MASRLSNSFLDKLGERLKIDDPTADDLRILDEFRRSFDEAIKSVTDKLRGEIGAVPKIRLMKTTGSIIAKLRREGNMRLSRIQDIAGCRIFANDTIAQNALITRIMNKFQSARKVDRREKPSHGYRAVHVIAQHDGKAVEIQVRTDLQHRWAEICEKAADHFDGRLKYGGGPPEMLRVLTGLSERLASLENKELRSLGMRDVIYQIASETEVSRLRTVHNRIQREKDELLSEMQLLIKKLKSG